MRSDIVRIPYLSLLALVSVIKLLQILASGSGSDHEDYSTIDLSLSPTPICYAEQQFALGRKIPLSSADLYDLELIPGVSDRLGNNIIKSRQDVIDFRQEEDRYKSPFKQIYGVGNKMAAKLEFYLEPF